MADNNWYKVENNILKIQLEGNATTGYLWDYKIKNEWILKAEFSKYIPNDAPPKSEDGRKTKNATVGLGGKYIAEFSVIGNGVTSLSFRYKRPWEDTPIDTKTLNIKIQNKNIVGIDEA